LTLKTWYEAVSEKILPALRALVAEILIKEYNYTQVQAAKALGVTQPAISHYLSGKRGRNGLSILKKDETVVKNARRIAYCVTVSDYGCVSDILDKLIDYIRGSKEILSLILDKEYKNLLEILANKSKK
jgi:predicted transcriptional regulator